MTGSRSRTLLGRKATHNYLILHLLATFELHIYSEFRLEVVSHPRITPAGKAQADSKAQQPRQGVSISRGLQRRHRESDGVIKPLLSGCWKTAPEAAIRRCAAFV